MSAIAWVRDACLLVPALYSCANLCLSRWNTILERRAFSRLSEQQKALVNSPPAEDDGWEELSQDARRVLRRRAEANRRITFSALLPTGMLLMLIAGLLLQLAFLVWPDLGAAPEPAQGAAAPAGPAADGADDQPDG